MQQSPSVQQSALRSSTSYNINKNSNNKPLEGLSTYHKQNISFQIFSTKAFSQLHVSIIKPNVLKQIIQTNCFICIQQLCTVYLTYISFYTQTNPFEIRSLKFSRNMRSKSKTRNLRVKFQFT